jgi:branched-subunit amino acid aminotransferase/4-amino-4-deoxychorismate lyase
MERSALLALIQLEQFTSIQDLMGTCLYDHIETKVEAQTLNAEEEGLFKLVKYSLAMYSAKAAISILRTATAITKAEEQKQDQYILDTISTTIDSKIGYINKRVTNYILNNAAIKAIATADGCDNDLFNEEDTYQGSVFYPQDGITVTYCEDGSVSYNP